MAYVTNCKNCNRSSIVNRVGFCSEECTVVAYEQLNRKNKITAFELDEFVQQKYQELGHLENGNLLIAEAVIKFMS